MNIFEAAETGKKIRPIGLNSNFLQYGDWIAHKPIDFFLRCPYWEVEPDDKPVTRGEIERLLGLTKELDLNLIAANVPKKKYCELLNRILERGYEDTPKEKQNDFL
jgi:hypothetical protein